MLKRLAKSQVLILDDFGLEPLGAAERKELLEVLEDRYQLSSTVVTSPPLEQVFTERESPGLQPLAGTSLGSSLASA